MVRGDSTKDCRNRKEILPKAKPPISITFLPEEFVVHASHRTESILEAALEAGYELEHSCGGYGTCGTCLVIVEKGLEKMEPRGEIESEMASDRSFRPEERLCCQNRPVDGLVLRAAHKKD